MSSELLSAFIETAGVAKAPPAVLAAALAAAHARAAPRWPEIDVSAAELARHLGRACAEIGDEPALLDTLHVDDLLLACAALAHQGRAPALLLAHVAEAVDERLRALRVSPAVRDEVWQELQARLFVGGPEGEPALGRYSGRARLGGFAALAAARLSFNQVRDARRRTSAESDAALLGALWGPQPEHEVMRSEQQGLARETLAEALTALAPRQRVLLRMHLLDGLGASALARTFATPRSTMTRWLDEARGELRAALHAALVRRVGPEAAAAAGSLIDSRVDLSLSRLLDG